MATGLEQQLIKGARFAAGPVVPIGSIAAAGFEKGQKKVKAEQLAKQQADFERRKLEAERLTKQNENTNKILDALYKNKDKVRVNGELLKGYWKEQNLLGAAQVKQNELKLTERIKSGQLGKYDSLIAQDDLVNTPLSNLKEAADKYVGFADAVDEVKANLSSSVSADQATKINGILSGDKEIINQVSKELDISPSNLLNVETLEKLGYMSADTSGINTLFDATQKSAQSAASKGADMTGYIKKVEQDLAQLTLTDKQYVSAAFDFLGKTTPGFTNPFDSYIEDDMRAAFDAKDPNLLDTNGDGDSMPEIKAFVHKAMIEGAKDAYEGYKKDYADKFEPKDDSKTNKKELQRIKHLEIATPLINETKIPRDKNGNVAVDDVLFTSLLARLNLAVDSRGAASGDTGSAISVKSNITNKTLNITSNMIDSDVKNALMLLSGSTVQEANESYPLDPSGPLSEKASDIFTPPHLRK